LIVRDEQVTRRELLLKAESGILCSILQVRDGSVEEN